MMMTFLTVAGLVVVAVALLVLLVAIAVDCNKGGFFHSWICWNAMNATCDLLGAVLGAIFAAVSDGGGTGS